MNRLFKINLIGVIMACPFLFYLFFYTPETRLSYASSELAQAVANHKSEDALKRAAGLMLREVEVTQSLSLNLFRVVILFNVLMLSIFAVNLLLISRLRREQV